MPYMWHSPSPSMAAKKAGTRSGSIFTVTSRLMAARALTRARWSWRAGTRKRPLPATAHWHGALQLVATAKLRRSSIQLYCAPLPGASSGSQQPFAGPGWIIPPALAALPAAGGRTRHEGRPGGCMNFESKFTSRGRGRPRPRASWGLGLSCSSRSCHWPWIIRQYTYIYEVSVPMPSKLQMQMWQHR
eukprot:SAG22_NODE_1514_length_4253_cov_1.546943_4_plen_188_part_00